VYHALEARDPQAAAAAMFTHLRASQERWLAEPSVAPDSAPSLTVVDKDSE
jgi:GntR family transcriptional repressor for pyruvate dehydrogenase complex